MKKQTAEPITQTESEGELMIPASAVHEMLLEAASLAFEVLQNFRMAQDASWTLYAAMRKRLSRLGFDELDLIREAFPTVTEIEPDQVFSLTDRAMETLSHYLGQADESIKDGVIPSLKHPGCVLWTANEEED